MRALAGQRVGQPLEHADPAPLGHHDSVAIFVERTAGLGRVGVAGQRPFGLKARENPKRVNALGDAAGQSLIDFAQPQHLHAVNQTGVARRTRRPDGQMWTGNPQADGYFAGRVVGHRAGIVMMGPDSRVVVVARNLIDFVLRLDVAVLGDPEEDADSAFFNRFPGKPRVLHRFVGTVNGQRARSCAPPQVLLLLVAEDVAAADAGDRRRHIAGFVRDDSRAALQEGTAEFRQIVAVRCRQTDAGNDDTIAVGHAVGHQLG